MTKRESLKSAGTLKVRKNPKREQIKHTWDVSDNGDFFGDLFTLKVLLRGKDNKT